MFRNGFLGRVLAMMCLTACAAEERQPKTATLVPYEDSKRYQWRISQMCESYWLLLKTVKPAADLVAETNSDAPLVHSFLTWEHSYTELCDGGNYEKLVLDPNGGTAAEWYSQWSATCDGIAEQLPGMEQHSVADLPRSMLAKRYTEHCPSAL